MLCVTAQVGQIPEAVMMGQRPNLQEIRGPDDFEMFAKTWIAKCWNQDPEQRPTFGGELHNLTTNLAPAFFICFFGGEGPSGTQLHISAAVN